MKEIFGNLLGLKASQIKRLENLSRRRVPPRPSSPTNCAVTYAPSPLKPADRSAFSSTAAERLFKP